MTVFSSRTIDMLQNCIQNDRTFGVVCYGYPEMLRIGTTAEIYEYVDGGARRGFRLKAKGRQRFKILRITVSILSTSMRHKLKILNKVRSINS